MRILVTGGTGFIGQALLQAWRGEHDLFALARRDPGLDGVHWLPADLSEPLNDSRLPGEMDVLVHLAQSRNYRDFPARAADIFAVNVQAAAGLLEYARRAKVRQFLLASTGSVLAASDRPLTEASTAAPSNFYAAGKYAAELIASQYRPFFPVTILRLFSPYGPGQPETMLIPRLLSQVRQGQRIRIQGDPGLRINPVFIEDVTRAFSVLLTRPDVPLVNVAGREPVDLRALVEFIGRVCGRKPDVEHDLSGAAPSGLVGDIRLLNELGAGPLVPLADGLGRLG